jgi:aminodeoxyfutalosine synthase
MTTLAQIRDKIGARERLTFDDGLALFAHPDWIAVGSLAHTERVRRHGDRAYYNHNMRLELTNVCVASCRFCSFSRRPGAPGARTMELEQAWQELERMLDDPPRELHVVGGLNPALPLSYYEELLRGFKRIKPDIVLKCCTAVEIHFFAQQHGMTHEQVLVRLRAAGLDCLPGGGAEIFDPQVRARIAPNKADANEYLAVHQTAHRLGMKTNVTMLYGHVETFEHRVDHLLRIRKAQDQSGGFEAFVPLAFHPASNPMHELPGPTGVDHLRTIAVARLLLDNVDHIKAYWVSTSPGIAQVALRFGADDLDGTTVHETIYHCAGSGSPQGLDREQLVRLIHEAGFVPVERDTHYAEVAS